VSRKAAFAVITAHIPAAARAIDEAQAYVASDPPGSLAKSRLAAEVLIKSLGRGARLARQDRETAESYLRRVAEAGRLPPEVSDAFHRVRILGNAAVHENRGSAAEANEALERLAVIGDWLAARARPQPSRRPRRPPSPKGPAAPGVGAARAPKRSGKAKPKPGAAGAVRNPTKPLAPTRPRGSGLVRGLFWVIALVVALFVALRWLPHLLRTLTHS